MAERGWNEQLGPFVPSYGEGVPDASLSLMPVTGFSGPRDRRRLSVLDAIGEQLVADSLSPRR